MYHTNERTSTIAVRLVQCLILTIRSDTARGQDTLAVQSVIVVATHVIYDLCSAIPDRAL